MLPEAPGEDRPNSGGSTPFMFSDAKEWLSPKTNGLWKPVIAAVNGMACGGAFYLLGEADIILAAEHATFFDPHVTYGITMAYESAMMRPKLPLHEVLRMSLLGNWERMTAQRALQVGLSHRSSTAQRAERAGSVGGPCDRVSATDGDSGDTARGVGRRGTVPVAGAGAGWAFSALGNDPYEIDRGDALFKDQPRIQYRLR